MVLNPNQLPWDSHHAATLIAILEREFAGSVRVDIEAVVQAVLQVLPDAESPFLLDTAREWLTVDEQD